MSEAANVGPSVRPVVSTPASPAPAPANKAEGARPSLEVRDNTVLSEEYLDEAKAPGQGLQPGGVISSTGAVTGGGAPGLGNWSSFVSQPAGVRGGDPPSHSKIFT